jgi:RNA polymerase sigma-32 factor
LFFNLRDRKAQIQSIGGGDLQPCQFGKIARMLDVPEQEVVNMNRRLIGWPCDGSSQLPHWHLPW